MSLTLSCAFATSMATPDHVAVAESLGYERAWLYDSPALYPDVWVQLCRSAERTSRIGLGPAVLVPSLRHPMVTAAAIVTLVELAGPGRVAVALGTGFTGRFALGQQPMRWAEVAEYVVALRGLLHGETVQWEGAPVRMLQPEGYGSARPADVPILLGANGPRGLAVARALADGVFIGGARPVPGVAWEPYLLFGTVLDPGEDPGSPRVLDAAGHALPVTLHYLVERGLPASRLPGGEAWLAAYADVAAEQRHLALHDRHLVGVNDRDRPFVTGEALVAAGLALEPAQLRARLEQLEAGGATEVAYQPAGPDIARELEAFAAAARG
jgi:5,10-methylenetetrahydromethanopterin reductase